MKTIAIMQPYFFPYIGYFSLIHCVDEFIIFDVPQYDRKGWMHRNRILKPNEGVQFIHAGIEKPPFKAAIKDVMLAGDDEWKSRIFRQLAHYKKMAPHYEQTVSWLELILGGCFATLVDLNHHVLLELCRLLHVETPISVFSHMDINVNEVSHPGEWALEICKNTGATGYVNPMGGRSIFVSDDFDEAGISLRFLDHKLPKYNQYRVDFEKGLSIIDILMFNTVNDVRIMLDQYSLSKV